MISRISFLIISSLIFSCTVKNAPEYLGGKPLTVVTTTGMLYDAVKIIGHDRVEVNALMGPGVDPHLYKATQGDLAKLKNADLVVYNGLMLEGKMGEVLEKLGNSKPVVAAAESIPTTLLLASVQYKNAYDPHVWFDVSLWKFVVKEITQKLMLIDTANAPFYEQNQLVYLSQLDSLHEHVKVSIQSIPEKQRVLITAHDAFSYFGRAYGIEVAGLQGISTVSEFGLRDIAQLIDLIMDRNIKSIFMETSVSDKAIKAVIAGCAQKGQSVKIGGSLYSDAMGAPGTLEGTYIGMVNANVKTITESLK
jgi:manganese/zinc/iron transport system substrate-binding protein